jgi:hypothetical protein
MIDGRQILSIVLQGGLRNIVDLAAPPCLDSFSHPLTQAPAGARRRAWLKLQECERRFVVATWAMNGTDPVSGRNHVIAEDSLTALFQSIEATFQVLKEEVDWKALGTGADSWLNGLASYSLAVRALRHDSDFTVHIDELNSTSSMSIPLFPKSNDPFVSRSWLLPELDVARLSSLRSPKVMPADLPTWNRLRHDQPAQVILEGAVRDLRTMVEEGEKLPP